MADNVQELAELPKEFVRDGTLFIRRCTKRMPTSTHSDITLLLSLQFCCYYLILTCVLRETADKREFTKISQAVGMGFLIMVCEPYDSTRFQAGQSCRKDLFANCMLTFDFCGLNREQLVISLS